MKVLVVVGTRPEAIKMAPVIRALEARPDAFSVSVCLTAQHRDLLDQVVETFGLRVDYDLDLMHPDQTIYDTAARVLTGMQGVLAKAGPDVALVHGDTTTTFAAALAAHYAKVRVGHVEAGLRTHDPYQPFPEEMNRHLADVLSTYHYAPTEQAKANLLAENVPEAGIVVTGNTVIDALLHVADRPCPDFADARLAAAGKEKKLLLVTAHRRESFGAPLREMFGAMRALVEANADLEIVYPVHPNPNVQAAAQEVLGGVERVALVEPLAYAPFVHLMKRAYIVLTDSGGIQEEAPSLGKPVLVMRKVTERPEAIAAGTARLVGTKRDAIVRGVQGLLDDEAAYAAMARRGNPYGDGHAAERIADHLLSFCGNTVIP